MSRRARTIENLASQSEPLPSFARLLQEMDDGETEVPDLLSDPGAAFRFVYDGWVKRGGYERGKRRHSVRQMKAWLKENQVLSLETKLAGRTRLQHSDALSLLRLFLEFWTYDEISGEYIAYAPPSQIDDITRQFLVDLFPKNQTALLLPERSRKIEVAGASNEIASPNSRSALELTMPMEEAILDLFAQSDVVITVSRARAVIGASPPAAMAAFHDLTERLYQIDIKDQRKRTLIWIIDFGLRTDKENARAAIYNFYFLIAQFRAIALIERADRENFYNWLLDNVCIIVGSLRYYEIDRVYSDAMIDLPEVPPNLMWFQSDRLFLESVPGRWIEAKGSEAFGRRQRDLWNVPTITVHLKLDDWQADQLNAADSEVDVRRNLRYLFHAEVAPRPDDPNEPAVRCISLPEPGSRWSDAYRMAVQAAFGRLGRSYEQRAGPVRPEEALAAFRSQHFAVLRLSEFLTVDDILVDQDGELSARREC